MQSTRLAPPAQSLARMLGSRHGITASTFSGQGRAKEPTLPQVLLAVSAPCGRHIPAARHFFSVLPPRVRQQQQHSPSLLHLQPRPASIVSRLPAHISTQSRRCSFRRNNMCKLHAGDEFAAGGANPDPTKDRVLLPAKVVPRHYDLTLEPDLEKFTFDGTVIIDLDVVEDTNSISLNTLELEIQSTKVSSNGEVVSSAPTVSYDEKDQVSKFDFDGSLAKGSKAQLEIKFTGILNDKMAGFYRSSFKRDDGSSGILATSQMEPTDARRAFPCFDEPSLKAKFTVTLVADKKYTCLSNMDVANEVDQGSKKAVHFNTSPLMSTYLIAFIVGELNYIETDEFRVPMRVYAPPGQDIENGRFALNLAAKTLAFYEKTFGIDFPLPKMDQVAIPDFAAGAMENWGLVTYRVVDLMLDEKSSSAKVKERVAEVVQHELAHQWFGNLVTMDWWEGLWLNEGFATWVSLYSGNAFYPEWNIWQNFVEDNLQAALGLDSLRSSHPIEVPVKRADEVNQIFDAISYSKGSCVLRMISNYLGEDIFLEGVRQYLKKHAYGNTQTTDLWDSLSAVSGKPVSDVMTTWTKKIGYPVITVKEDGSSVEVQQNRFLRTGDVKPEEDQTLYPVFLGIRTKDGVDKAATLNDRSSKIQLPSDDFFKLNADHTSLYRVAYTPERLEKLGNAAKADLLTVEDRTGMIADAASLAMSGYQKTSGVLNLFKGFAEEQSYTVWSELLTRLSSIELAFQYNDPAISKGLLTFRKDLSSSMAHKLGWQFSDSDGHVEQQLKALMFGSAGLSGDEKVIAAAKEMFSKYAAGDAEALHPNLRGSVFSMNLKYGGVEEYDKLLKIFRSSTSADVRNTCLRCFGRAEDPALIKRTLGLIFSDDVKNQDSVYPPSSLRNHAAGAEAGFEYLTTNWDTIYEHLPPGLTMLSGFVQVLTSALGTKDQLAKLEAFFADKDTAGYNQALEQSKDSIKSRISYVDRDVQDVTAWLKANGYMA